MTFLRLLPRLLLCSLLALLTFGVSGWLLRPRPTWTVDLGDDSLNFTPGESSPAAADPIWITSVINDEHSTEWTAAFRPADGRLLKRVTGRDDRMSLDPHRTPDQRLVTTQWKEFPEGSPKRDEVGQFTEFTLSDAFSDATTTRKFDGFWRVADDGRRAWLYDASNAVFKFAVVDLVTGKRLHEIDRPKEYPHLDDDRGNQVEAFSPNLRWIVVCETARDPNRRPAGLDVWDVEKGALVQTLYPRAWNVATPLRRLTQPAFGRGPDQVGYHLPPEEINGKVRGRGRYECFDLARRVWVDSDWTPSGVEEPHTLSMHLEAGGEQLWTEFSERGRAWYAAYAGEKELHAWRPVLVPLTTTPDRLTVLEQSLPGTLFFAFSASVWRVPGKQSVVAFAAQPSLKEAVPEPLHFLLPQAWNSSECPMRAFWNDGIGSQWLDIGLGGDIDVVQLRSNALLTIMTLPDGKHQLQSWPLPPRDPRLPSTLIALATSAALWLLLARRARRRALQHQAS